MANGDRKSKICVYNMTCPYFFYRAKGSVARYCHVAVFACGHFIRGRFGLWPFWMSPNESAVIENASFLFRSHLPNFHIAYKIVKNYYIAV